MEMVCACMGDKDDDDLFIRTHFLLKPFWLVDCLTIDFWLAQIITLNKFMLIYAFKLIFQRKLVSFYKSDLDFLPAKVKRGNISAYYDKLQVRKFTIYEVTISGISLVL